MAECELRQRKKEENDGGDYPLPSEDNETIVKQNPVQTENKSEPVRFVPRQKDFRLFRLRFFFPPIVLFVFLSNRRTVECIP